MEQEQQARLQKFEQMLAAVEADYQKTLERMAELRAKGRTRSTTYYQLMASKMTAQNLLSMYAVYGLRDTLPGDGTKE